MFRDQLSLMFHCTQMKFSPLRSVGIACHGLSDGETMERLWSYFSKMTMEMQPAHRTDMLVHALVYYGITAKTKLGILELVTILVYYTLSY